MGKASAIDDDDASLFVSTAPYPWEREATTKEVQTILTALDAPPVSDEVRLALQRALYRRNLFGGDGRGHIVITLRCILESEGNEGALIEPIVGAVSMAVRGHEDRGLALVEAFDKIPLTALLQTVRGLDLFSEKSIGHYYSIALRNKLAAILDPLVSKPVPVRAKPEPKPPRSVTRIPEVQTNIHLGVELLALRATTKSNCAFGRLVRAKGFDTKHASDISAMMQVARIYANRPEIFTKLSWGALVRLSSPTMPRAGVRQDLEARILAGEKIVASDVILACGTPKSGPARHPADQPAPRMAA